MSKNFGKGYLNKSLQRQTSILKSSIVLNPVENFPFPEDIWPAASEIHGLYNTDKVRTDAEKGATKHQFSGRDRLAYDSRLIYSSWADALGADDLTMRLLSGLHAQTVLFMGLTKPGDNVLLLPEVAGGHMSTKAILERLSLNVFELPINIEGMTVDIDASISLAKTVEKPILFIDRSEGLNYENFERLTSSIDGECIFDGSQYLSNIIAGDYVNPFNMGFDIFVSTTHKNFPGPQKALIACKEKSATWIKILQGISCYVSNMHTFSTYSAGMTIDRLEWLKQYSSRMLKNTLALSEELSSRGFPVVRRRNDAPNTHHIWIDSPNSETAYQWFKRLERARILVNYRKLPYHRGTGLRLGLAALTRQGMTASKCAILADLIVSAATGDDPSEVKRRTRTFALELWDSM